MTQIKAKELVERFLNAGFNCKDCDMPYCDIPCVKLSIFEAKQCAFIAVDEILKELECAYNGEPITTNEHKLFWKEVKQEINNL